MRKMALFSKIDTQVYTNQEREFQVTEFLVKVFGRLLSTEFFGIILSSLTPLRYSEFRFKQKIVKIFRKSV